MYVYVCVYVCCQISHCLSKWRWSGYHFSPLFESHISPSTTCSFLYCQCSVCCLDSIPWTLFINIKKYVPLIRAHFKFVYYRVREKFCNPLVLWTTIIEILVVQNAEVHVQKVWFNSIYKWREYKRHNTPPLALFH